MQAVNQKHHWNFEIALAISDWNTEALLTNSSVPAQVTIYRMLRIYRNLYANTDPRPQG